MKGRIIGVYGKNDLMSPPRYTWIVEIEVDNPQEFRRGTRVEIVREGAYDRGVQDGISRSRSKPGDGDMGG